MSLAALIKNPSHPTKTFLNVAFWIIAATSSLVVLKTCSSEVANTNHVGYDPTTGARMFVPVSDTTKPEDPAILQAQWNSYVDSLQKKKSLFDLLTWMDENVPPKQQRESKFIDVYNAYLQQQYSIWLSNRQKK